MARDAAAPDLRYGWCWEDADVLLDALAVRPGDTCVSIASAGDNTLALLLADPARVVAIDRNPAQIASLELRIAAYRALEQAEVRELLGSLPSTRRAALYRRCRALLPPGARAFWDGRPASIAAGAASTGRLERHFAWFRRAGLPLVHPRARVRRLLAGGSPAERAARYAGWDTWRWRALFRVFFSRFLLERLGRSRAQFAHVEGPVADRLLGRARHALVDLDPARNPYLHLLLCGRHADAGALPAALRPEAFDVIRGRLERLEVHAGTLESWLAAAQARSVDRFNLSDVFEYVSPAEHVRLLEQVARVGRSGARVACWNLFVDRCRPAALADRLVPLEAEARALSRADRALFYERLVLEQVA